MCCNISTTSRADENLKETVKVDSALTEMNIYNMLIINGIKYPEVVLSQIMIETGYLSSKLVRTHNNLLGMTVPSKRETTAINKNGFARYITWIDCIVDYKFYQDYVLSRHDIKTRAQYIAFLHKNYAKSPTYKKRLTQLSKEYELRNPYNFTNFKL